MWRGVASRTPDSDLEPRTSNIERRGVIAINIGKKALIIVSLAIIVSLVCGAAWSAQKLNVEKKGTYVYWFTYTDGLGKDQITQPVKFKGKSTELDAAAIGSTSKNAKLYVMDKKSGNLAISDYAVPADPKAAKPIDLDADAFQYVRTVRLRAVSKDGAPIESGVVEITDGEGTPMRAVVTPADEGVASFQNVATGELSVKVHAEGAEKTIDSDIELSAKRSTRGFERNIKVAGDVDTLPIPEATTVPASGKRQAEEKPSGGGFGAILQTLAGLIFVGVVIAIVVAVVKSKGITTKEALEKMGVQFPEAGPVAATAMNQQGTPAVDPNICEFCGERKDATGQCACTVGPGASALSSSPRTAGAPRLVGSQGTYSGHIFELTADSATLGRDAGSTIPLVNDTTASRRHATITKSNGDFVIRDEGSSNGTFVNGARITEQKLSPGDEVQIGGTRFRFEV